MSIKKLKKRKDKRAVSPLIATVLMIGIVIVAAAIIFAWSKKFIGEQIEKYGSRIDVVCERLDYTAQLYKTELTGVYAVIISNSGNDNIHQVNIKVIKGGNSAVKAFTPKDRNMIAKGEIGNITFAADLFPEKVQDFDKVEVTPVLLGTGVTTKKVKLSVCKDKSMILLLKNA